MLNFSRILSILFLILGGILGLYGYFTQGDTMYAISLGQNINLIWGLVLMGAGTIFGIFSLFPD
ncbi:MAG: hypothetical protein O9264_03165 [Leptospira sp.]|jgi:hypothetical protein|nr:hypothetical protein [Leptospira sp.]